MDNNKDNNKDSPIITPGLIADHLAPETASRSEGVEDSHQSHFSSSDLSEAQMFLRKKLLAFALSFEKSTLA